MYHPTRGGNRGGQDQFDWEDVKADKYRESYLGESKLCREVKNKIVTSFKFTDFCFCKSEVYNNENLTKESSLFLHTTSR